MPHTPPFRNARISATLDLDLSLVDLAQALREGRTDVEELANAVHLADLRYRCGACGGWAVYRQNTCGGCGCVKYCSRRCQREHWTRPRPGGDRAGVLESSFVAEVKSDLMGEQTILCGMLQTGAVLNFDKAGGVGAITQREPA